MKKYRSRRQGIRVEQVIRVERVLQSLSSVKAAALVMLKLRRASLSSRVSSKVFFVVAA
jgi:hypothetical protein